MANRTPRAAAAPAAEALGRGGAFTAKADDATALQYNVAGLARQRGTRLLLDGNLLLATMETLARAAAGAQAADAESPSVAPSEDDAQADETSAAAALVPESAHRVKTRHNAHAKKKPRRLNARRSR